VFVDDATSRLLHLECVERESTFAYFHVALEREVGRTGCGRCRMPPTRAPRLCRYD
jgi:hypothetical protein